MDSPWSYDRRMIAGAIGNLEFFNRLTGGFGMTERAVFGLCGERARPLKVLEVACGGGGSARHLQKAGCRRGVEVSVVATDVSAEILEVAASAESRGGGGVRYAEADARDLPFGDNSFDVVVCSLVLHHFDPPEAVGVIAEMLRVARSGIVVNDIVRSLPLLWGLSLVCGLFPNPLIRHDGPLSARKAYTEAEIACLLYRARASNVERAAWIPALRLALTAST